MKSIASSIFNRWQVFVFLFISGASGVAQAEPCNPAPGNEYEKILCQLKRGGRGEGLPSLYDFRKNPPLMQAFLLKKPAERAGIPLRIPERANAETVDRQADLLLASVEKTLAPSPSKQKAVEKPITVKPVSTATLASKPVQSVVAESKSAPEPFATCALKNFELDCTEGRYRLVTNQANQHLREGALSEENRLGLPVESGQNRDEYLQHAYARYLEGMIDIGLGASTMSYSKFVRLYDHITAQKLDFASRFETMYHFLKQDKATIGVNTHPLIAAGFTTRYCSELTSELLACEYQRDNHVFVKIKTSGRG